MLDLGFVRANLDVVKAKLRLRGMDPEAALGDFATLDAERRAAITEVENLKAERNRLSAEVATIKRAGGDAAAVMEQTKSLKEKIEGLEGRAAELDAALLKTLQAIPNLPADDVPEGADEHGNLLIKTWGEKASFDFEPKPHWEIAEALGIVDFERAAKISGARMVVHFGQGARLERALAAFMLDLHTREHGYMEVLPPFMVNSRTLFGTGQLPKFAEDLFHCDDSGPYEGELKDGDHWLIPTSEVPITNLYAGETLDAGQLPISYTAHTPCFRAEAGSHGRDVRGMIRQHQFQKVELIKFTTPET